MKEGEAPGLIGVREDTDAMVTRPRHMLQMSFQTDLCPGAKAVSAL